MLIGACVHVNTQAHTSVRILTSCPHTHSDTFCAVEKSTRMGSLACCRRGMSNAPPAHLPTLTPTNPREDSTCTLEASRNRAIKLSGLLPIPWPLSLTWPAYTPTHAYVHTHARTHNETHSRTPTDTFAHTLYTRKQAKAKGDSTYLIPFNEPASGPPGQAWVRVHC